MALRWQTRFPNPLQDSTVWIQDNPGGGSRLIFTIPDTDHMRGAPAAPADSAPTDVQAAYERRANCYIVKPSTFTEFARAINGIGGFWLDLVTLPPAAAAVGT